MKDVTFEIEVVTAILANGSGPHVNKDCFQRDNEDMLVWQQSWWYSAFAQAIDLAHVRGIKPGDIHMNLSVKAKTEMYSRKYGENKYREHEAIMPGTRVTFEAVVSDHVTESSLTLILNRMGKYVGLSPYGYKLGFGHFSVISVKVAPSEYTDNEPNTVPASA